MIKIMLCTNNQSINFLKIFFTILYHIDNINICFNVLYNSYYVFEIIFFLALISFFLVTKILQ